VVFFFFRSAGRHHPRRFTDSRGHICTSTENLLLRETVTPRSARRLLVIYPEAVARVFLAYVGTRRTVRCDAAVLFLAPLLGKTVEPG
jgi:hypothetical protein